MEIRHVRTFLTVAEYGTILGAANALHLAPSSVSQQIRVLEGGLGVELFERSPTGMRLTDAGRVLAADAPELIARWTRLGRAVTSTATTTPLRVASTEHMVAAQVPRVLREFGIRHPGRQVAADALPDPSSVVASVACGRSDVGLVLDTHHDEADRWLLPATRRGDVEFADLIPVTTAVAVATDHRLALHDRLTVDDLAGEHIVGGPPRCSSHLAIDALLPGQIESMPSLIVAVSWAAHGLGAVIAPRFVIGQAATTGGVVVIDLDTTGYTSWIGAGARVGDI
ncbi:LysR family transcriptional regulator [Gordonia jinhuaensis]|uniref:LysR family transcriptional regulator n=1 Tax=Gordonia jinhuaensis TaxID=1517702 RepID=A0A916T8F2_9ACTN|nr:LysR family transcriptional regulator [Gordonia jinhuaensis]GGB34127.1 LysR family transcriptional regulator [Gordonia jinhuaensis]